MQRAAAATYRLCVQLTAVKKSGSTYHLNFIN